MATIARRWWPFTWRRRGSQFVTESAPIAGRSGHDRGSALIAVIRSDQVGWAVPISRFSVWLMHDCRPFDEDLTVPTSHQVSHRSRSSAFYHAFDLIKTGSLSGCHVS